MAKTSMCKSLKKIYLVIISFVFVASVSMATEDPFDSDYVETL